MVVVSLQICKYEWDFVGSNGMAVDEVPGEEGREAKSQPGELAQRLVAEDLDGAVVRLQRRFESVRRAGSEPLTVTRPAYPMYHIGGW